MKTAQLYQQTMLLSARFCPQRPPPPAPTTAGATCALLRRPAGANPLRRQQQQQQQQQQHRAMATNNSAVQPAYEPLPASMSARAQEVLREFGGPREPPPPPPPDPAAAAAALQARRADVLISTSELSARYEPIYLESVKEITLGGVPAVEVTPKQGIGADGKPRSTSSRGSSSTSGGQTGVDRGQTAAGGTVLYFHGGSLIVGCPMAQRHAYAPLAAAAGVRIVAVGYRLAPEHPFPSALDDAAAAYTALSTSTPPSQIILAGDSAGGNLAAALLLWIATKSELPLPAAAVLFSPWACLDNTLVDTRVTVRNSDPFLCPEILGDAAAAYTFGLSSPNDTVKRFRNPLASPALADWRAAAASVAASGRGSLPPVLAFAGTREIVLGDSVMLIRGLKLAGVDAQLSVTDGGWHGMVFGPPGPLEVPEAAEVYEEAAAFIQRCLSE